MHKEINLNIMGNEIEQMTIDGPSLRIQLKGQAVRRFPLRTLGHICITGDPANGADTLLALMGKRKLITLFSANGVLKGQLYNPKKRESLLLNLLEESAHDPALAQARAEWFENSRLQAFAMVGITKGCDIMAIRSLRKQLGRTLSELDLKREHKTVTKWLRGITEICITKILAKRGIPLHGHQCNRIRRQLGRIAEPVYLHAALHWLVANPAVETTPKNMTVVMGNFQRTLYPTLARCLYQLQVRLEQAICTPTTMQKRKHR